MPAFKFPRGLIVRCFDARVIHKGFLRLATIANGGLELFRCLSFNEIELENLNEQKRENKLFESKSLSMSLCYILVQN